MRGFTTDAYTGKSASVASETPLPSDVTFKEKAANRRLALLQTALQGRTPYLEGEFAKGIPTYVRRLTPEEAGKLVVTGDAYQCQKCALGPHADKRVVLHIPVGKYRDDVELTIGSGKNIALEPRE